LVVGELLGFLAPFDGGTRVRSMRAKLFMLVLVAVIPSALLVLVLLIGQYSSQVTESRNQALARARALAAAVDNQILQVESALQGLATAGSLVDGDLSGFHESAAGFRSVAGIANVMLTDREGKLVVNTMQPYGGPLRQLGETSPSRVVISEGRPVARTVMGSITHVPVTVVGVPVTIGGEVRYSISSAISKDRFDKLVADQRLPDGWIAAIVDERGMIAWRNIASEQFVTKPATATLRENMAREREGYFEGKSLEGVDTVTVFTLAPVSGWTMVFGIPQTEFHSNLLRSLALLALGTGLVFALGAAAAWSYGRQIVQSTSALVQMSSELARRDDVAMPELEFREARQLGDAMLRTSRLLREAYTEVAHKEERLRALLNAAIDGVIVIDGDSRVVQSNAAACRMFGWSQDEMEGRLLETLLPGDDCGVRSDGTKFPVEASVAGFESDGQAFRVAIVRDITERRRVEDELLRSNIELRQFAHAASHDMRSPLRSIIGLLSVVSDSKDGELGGRGPEFVARALRAARQLDRFTLDLLTYAKLEGPASAPAPVNLEQTLLESLALLESEFEDTGAKIAAGPLPMVQGHASQLLQLFHNLLGNAIKFRSERPVEIRIAAVPVEHGWEITVADNGIGIEPEFREKVFEMFQRLHTHSVIPGSGIGLAMCRKIVQHHRGRIWVESTYGEGSTFHFTLQLGADA